MGKLQTPKGQTPNKSQFSKPNFENSALELYLAFGGLAFGILKWGGLAVVRGHKRHRNQGPDAESVT
jgi:hypothetical protein